MNDRSSSASPLAYTISFALLAAATSAACGSSGASPAGSDTSYAEAGATDGGSKGGPVPASTTASPAPAGSTTVPPVKATTPFVLASSGCAMSHCDPGLNDYDPMTSPSGIATTWNDSNTPGSLIGLGCASNGSVAVCTVAGTPAVIAYDAEGNRLWTSGSKLSATTTWTSAAMVDASGGAIIADDVNIYRFGPTGAVVWQQATSGGDPISPIPLPNGLTVLATKASKGADGYVHAPISTYDMTTGAPGTPIELTDSDTTGDYIWETANTPTSKGNRIYVSMSRTPKSGSGTDPLKKGALFAFDVGTSGAPVQKWSFGFEGPSNSSPAATANGIYFDGAGTAADGTASDPVFFGVADGETQATLLWTFHMPSQPNCNAAHDPRGGILTFAPNHPYVWRLHETQPTDPGCTDGSCAPVVDQLYDFGQIFGAGATPEPVLVTGEAATATPQLIMGAGVRGGHPVVDIDLVSGQKRWSKDVGQKSVGQYPLLQNAKGKPVVVYTTIAGGTFGLVGE